MWNFSNYRKITISRIQQSDKETLIQGVESEGFRTDYQLPILKSVGEA